MLHGGAVEVLGEMDLEAAAEALAYMTPALAAGVLEDLADEQPELGGRLLAEMAPEDASTDAADRLLVRLEDYLRGHTDLVVD